MGDLTLQEQLNDAKASLHMLLTGRQARVFVDQNGERIEYTAANSAKLSQYVASLEQKVGTGSSLGPMSVWL